MAHMNIAHLIISSLVHGLIYGLIFKVFHHVSLAWAAIITVVGVTSIWLLARFVGSRR